MAHIESFARFVYEYARQATSGAQTTHERFLQAAYRAFLRRTLDEDGLRYYQKAMRHGLRRGQVVNALLFSDEYRRIHQHGYWRIRQSVWRELIRLALAERRLPSSSLFLRAVFRTLVLREPEDGGRADYLYRLQRGVLTHHQVITQVMASDEFQQVAGLPMHPLEAMHRTRMILFQQHLPPAQHIIDLGGAAHHNNEGALLSMGYPYTPAEIIIVDLPPDDRILGAGAAEQQREVKTGRGTLVRYLYGSMADLAPIADNSIDLVVSGESIEHVSETDADRVCQEVYRVLRPGGAFCLDTPNAVLTRLQSPDQLVHPEHQKEYYVHELREKLTHYGFTIAEEKALCPMPVSRASGVFDYHELVSNVRVTDNAEDGYMFYLKAVKSSS